MTVKLQLVPKASLQIKGVLGFKGDKGNTGSPTDPNAVTNVFLADMLESRIKGRASGAGEGDPQDLTPAEVSTMLGLGALATKTKAGNADLADMAANTVKANITGADDAPSDVTQASFATWLAAAAEFVSGVRSAIQAGAVINSASATYATNADITTVIPADDSIPQNTEGTQILSVSITPSATTSKLRARFRAFGAHTGAGNMTAALFTSGANALATSAVTSPAANYLSSFILEHEWTAGTTSPVTVSIRVGPSSGTMRLNGLTTGRLYGGNGEATLVVEEIKA